MRLGNGLEAGCDAGCTRNHNKWKSGMSWNDIMRRVLPPAWDESRKTHVDPIVTSPYGDTNRPKGSSNPHNGVDFKYFGGGDTELNKSNPAIRSPVSGMIEKAGDGGYGTITIRDSNGYLHQLLHTHGRHVAVGDPVVAGQLIGTMGDTGVVGSTPIHRHDHVHYQLVDRAGNKVNPMEYWDQQGPADPNPAPPAHLADYQRYLGTPGAVMGDTTANSPSAGPLPGPLAVDPATEARKKMRVLSTRRNPVSADPGGYDPNAPATVPNQIPSPDHSPTFDERFGNWVASPSAAAPLSPNQLVAPPPQPGSPPGMIAGQPMPDLPLPAWVFGLPDPRRTPGDEAWSLGQLGRAGWKR